MPVTATNTNRLHCAARTGALGFLLHAGATQAAPPAPPFDVAFRAWEIVTQLARSSGDAAVSGTCGKTFQASAVPALRRQTRQEQDAAAVACVQAARAACTSATLRRPPDIEKQCGEFR